MNSGPYACLSDSLSITLIYNWHIRFYILHRVRTLMCRSDGIRIFGKIHHVLHLDNKRTTWPNIDIFLYFKNISIWLNVLIMSFTRFRVNLHSIVTWISRISLLETCAISKVLSNCNGNRTHNHLGRKRKLSHLAKLASVRLRTKWLWVRLPFT